MSAARTAAPELLESLFAQGLFSRPDAYCHGDLNLGLSWSAIIVKSVHILDSIQTLQQVVLTTSVITVVDCDDGTFG